MALGEGVDDILTNPSNPTNWLLESGPFYDGQDQEKPPLSAAWQVRYGDLRLDRRFLQLERLGE